ncbi:MAG: hypothetical protein Solumvirus2_48 [Solumvirus sp.]|uniref:Uncharacterized protein n=1 Tax=Solumvirus sp. TaxID=2487773 RepID=A0A3G5AIV9_9VIRU|nr:MAG: hypothetical protein Solumvirus2_48 [Solumvirus sp.]
MALSNMIPIETTHLTDDFTGIGSSCSGTLCVTGGCSIPNKKNLVRTFPLRLPFYTEESKWDPGTRDTLGAKTLHLGSSNYEPYDIYCLKSQLFPFLRSLSGDLSLISPISSPTYYDVVFNNCYVDAQDNLLDTGVDSYLAAKRLQLMAEIYLDSEPVPLDIQLQTKFLEAVNRALDFGRYALVFDPEYSGTKYSAGWIRSVLPVIDWEKLSIIKSDSILSDNSLVELKAPTLMDPKVTDVSPFAPYSPVIIEERTVEWKLDNGRVYAKLNPKTTYNYQCALYQHRIIKELDNYHDRGYLLYNNIKGTPKALLLTSSSTASILDLVPQQGIYLLRQTLKLPIPKIKLETDTVNEFVDINIDTTDDVVIGRFQDIILGLVINPIITVEFRDDQTDTKLGVRGPATLRVFPKFVEDLRVLDQVSLDSSSLLGLIFVSNNPLIFYLGESGVYDYHGISLIDNASGAPERRDSMLEQVKLLRSEGYFGVRVGGDREYSVANIVNFAANFDIAIVGIISNKYIYLQSNIFSEEWFIENLLQYYEMNTALITLSPKDGIVASGDLPDGRRVILASGVDDIVIPKGYVLW